MSCVSTKGGSGDEIKRSIEHKGVEQRCTLSDLCCYGITIYNRRAYFLFKTIVWVSLYAGQKCGRLVVLLRGGGVEGSPPPQGSSGIP